MGNGIPKARNSELLTIVNVCIGLSVIFFLLLLVRDVITAGHGKAETASAPRRADTRTVKKNLNEYEAVLKNSPFGLPPAALTRLSGSSGASSVPSDLTLVGTISGRSGFGFAIFSDGSGRQEVYRLGETIPGAGKLERVDRDKVSVKGDGRVACIPIADILRITDVSAPRGLVRPSEFARSIGAGTFIVDQTKVRQAIEDPSQLMTDARLQPNFSNGKQEGFTLREVRSGGIYQSLGLQNGDVLLRINDYNISNPENALQAFTALRGTDRIQLDIMRGGSKMTLTYQIR